jgi:hypothetical protein
MRGNNGKTGEGDRDTHKDENGKVIDQHLPSLTLTEGLPVFAGRNDCVSVRPACLPTGAKQIPVATRQGFICEKFLLFRNNLQNYSLLVKKNFVEEQAETK